MRRLWICLALSLAVGPARADFTVFEADTRAVIAHQTGADAETVLAYQDLSEYLAKATGETFAILPEGQVPAAGPPTGPCASSWKTAWACAGSSRGTWERAGRGPPGSGRPQLAALHGLPAVTDDWNEPMFREAAGPMKAYFARCERAWREQHTGCGHWAYRLAGDAKQFQVFPPEVLEECTALLAEAAAMRQMAEYPYVQFIVTAGGAFFDQWGQRDTQSYAERVGGVRVAGVRPAIAPDLGPPARQRKV